jgi:hypothetical protein
MNGEMFMRLEKRELEQKATRYRQLARAIADQQTAERILALAKELEAQSAEVNDDQGLP